MLKAFHCLWASVYILGALCPTQTFIAIPWNWCVELSQSGWEWTWKSFLFLPSRPLPHSSVLTARATPHSFLLLFSSKPRMGQLGSGYGAEKMQASLDAKWWKHNAATLSTLYLAILSHSLSTCSGRLRPDRQVHCLSRSPTSPWDASNCKLPANFSMALHFLTLLSRMLHPSRICLLGNQVQMLVLTTACLSDHVGLLFLFWVSPETKEP